ncbi:MAG: methyltransferase domain-containing protein [Hyphomicrobiaceae bacterium]
MTDSSFYKDRWTSIAPDELARYQQMFQWNPASRVFYEAAAIGEGHVVCELGSGPGHTAVELARWVGPTGHVHALDINEDFVVQTERNAQAAGFENRITAQLCDGELALPLSDDLLDRVTVRNTLIYVDDALQTLGEFKRTLKPGGIAHAIEGDWPMMIVEPVPSDDWAAVVRAAGHACRTPKIGRRLHGLFRRAGFRDVSVQLITRPDTDGRLLGMVRNMAGYAKASGELDDAVIERVLASIDEAVERNMYLALAPQFVVTAKA